MPQQSVSKLWVALTMAEQVHNGKASYLNKVTLTKADRALFHQPMARLVENGPITVTIGQLMKASLTQSDNMANAVLTEQAGGDEAVRDWLAKYAPGISFGPGDREMQSGISGLSWNAAFSDRKVFETARGMVNPEIRTRNYRQYALNPIDGADVESLVRTLSALRMGDLPGSAQILSFLKDSRTGKARLNAGTPDGWTLLHKTGTGQNWNGRTAGFNDVGIMESPSGKSYAVAVMIGDSSSSVQEMQNAIANVARAVARYDQRYRQAGRITENTSGPESPGNDT
jgi:beta-lactamase class A